MKIFISWSGDRSKAMAEAIAEWLPKVIQALKPWISVTDIDKGTRWFGEISEKLKEISFGIVCLTPDNVNSPWILFESGAISKAVGKSLVCPILLGFEKSDLAGPLSQFNLTKYEKQDMYNLIITINKNIQQGKLQDHQLRESFDLWWPKLDEKISAIPADQEQEVVKRSEREILEEILNIVRAIGRRYDLSEKTKEIIETLDSKEQRVLKTIFGIGEQKISKENIAREMGVTVGEIEEIEANALRKLRHPITRMPKEKNK